MIFAFAAEKSKRKLGGSGVREHWCDACTGGEEQSCLQAGDAAGLPGASGHPQKLRQNPSLSSVSRNVN